jgi:hypothetical protein
MTVTAAAFADVRSFDRPIISVGRAGSRLVRNLLFGAAATATAGVAVIAAALVIGVVLPKHLPAKHGEVPRAKFGLRRIALAPSSPDIAKGFRPADIIVFPQSFAEAAPPARVAERKVDRKADRMIGTPIPPALPPALARARMAERQVAAIPPTPPQASTSRDISHRADNTVASASAPDDRTAVYDISARSVYLPNGKTLEAHSGLGNWRDDPRYVRMKSRGPTPPNTYDLSLREHLFHGVRAIRLTPVNDDKMYGRDGMLAHTYMLGPRGDSNGCVSFKNYPAFLRAFLKGDIDRLVVVPRHGEALARTARANGKRRIRYAANDR